jgi:hypothetical protein
MSRASAVAVVKYGETAARGFGIQKKLEPIEPAIGTTNCVIQIIRLAKFYPDRIWCRISTISEFVDQQDFSF